MNIILIPQQGGTEPGCSTSNYPQSAESLYPLTSHVRVYQRQRKYIHLRRPAKELLGDVRAMRGMTAAIGEPKGSIIFKANLMKNCVASSRMHQLVRGLALKGMNE